MGYIFVTDSMDLSPVNLTALAPKAAVLREITRNDNHWVVQGHLRSPILVPIESPYAISY